MYLIHFQNSCGQTPCTYTKQAERIITTLKVKFLLLGKLSVVAELSRTLEELLALHPGMLANMQTTRDH